MIREGRCVAFPTETVYGLGADACNASAVRKIFRIKGRPADNPLIVHLWSLDQLPLVAVSVPVMFWILANRFMPGPLSVVLRKSAAIPDIVTAGLPTVGVRFPDHPVARALLKACRVPVVAPSANLSGRPSPTRAEHVLEDLDGRIPAVLDGGTCRIGLESTVVDLTSRVPTILRPGGVTREDLEDALGIHVRQARHTRKHPASPGMKYRHYSPSAEVILYEGTRKEVVAAMLRTLRQLGGKKRVGVMAEESLGRFFRGYPFFSFGLEGVSSAGQSLFAGFRSLDSAKVDVILCQGFSEADLGSALMNRLRRAATRRVRV